MSYLVATHIYKRLILGRHVPERDMLDVFDQFGWRFETRLRHYTQNLERKWMNINETMTWGWDVGDSSTCTWRHETIFS